MRILESDRLYLRPIESGDATAVADAHFDWMDGRDRGSFAAQAKVAWWIQLNQHVTRPCNVDSVYSSYEAMCLKSNDEVVGFYCFDVVGQIYKLSATALASAHRGSGYFSEMCEADMRFKFLHENFVAVEFELLDLAVAPQSQGAHDFVSNRGWASDTIYSRTSNVGGQASTKRITSNDWWDWYSNNPAAQAAPFVCCLPNLPEHEIIPYA